MIWYNTDLDELVSGEVVLSELNALTMSGVSKDIWCHTDIILLQLANH